MSRERCPETMAIFRRLGDFGVEIDPEIFDDHLWIRMQYSGHEKIVAVKVIMMSVNSGKIVFRDEIETTFPNLKVELPDVRAGKYAINIQAKTKENIVYGVIANIRKGRDGKAQRCG